jgi:hypothetical protein
MSPLYFVDFSYFQLCVHNQRACGALPTSEKSASLDFGRMHLLYLAILGGVTIAKWVRPPSCNILLITTAEAAPTRAGHCDGGEKTLRPVT